ncbi:uncharacterized protein LOC111398192 [Olea europaea var. sylvestris]|uniref:uncharacterized protein LOC111398192 n=1 Tax=Olea europaea var. sylvestris TaxID=158386 RepID=UPI000C1CDE4C|nr:uncharacterized protein LOC111398192 [Olea europaea var. sylvestris]
MDPIIEFITSGNLPSDARLARSIRARAPRYCMISGVLFRRSITLPYLRCLRPSESSQALAEVHEGVCGNHQGARALAFKLVRYGHYWPAMKKDASEYVKRCDRCQRFGIPKVLIIDNGRQFDNQRFRNFCSNLGIDHRLTSVSHPQSNGLAETSSEALECRQSENILQVKFPTPLRRFSFSAFYF